MNFVPVYVEGVFVGVIVAVAVLVLQNVLRLYSAPSVKSLYGVLGITSIIALILVVLSGPFTALLFAEVGFWLSGLLLLFAVLFLLAIGRILVQEAREGKLRITDE